MSNSNSPVGDHVIITDEVEDVYREGSLDILADHCREDLDLGS